MFGSQSQFRLQNNSSFGQAASTTLSNPVLLPQSINSAIKQSAAAAAAQIGPIGTKANSFQTALGGAPPPGPPPPPAGTSPLHLIPYDTTGAAGASHYANARLAGLDTNSIFFCFLFGKKSLICLEGKSMTPHRGNTILFRSSQQLPRLCLGPSKGFLS